MRLNKRSATVLQDKIVNSEAQSKQQGALNGHILNEQNMQHIEKDFQKDYDYNQIDTDQQILRECQSSSCQQSYVEGFLKVAYQKSSAA